MTSNQTIYERITHRLLEQMRDGQLPWLKPWKSNAGVVGLPRNGATARPYSGINVLVLWATGRPDARWYTFNQAKKIGGRVLRGEKGSEVLFFKLRTRIDDRTGDEEHIPMAKTFHVFNHGQIAWPGDGPELPPPDAYVEAQQVLEQSGAVIIHGGEDAMYRPNLDVISLPRFETFRAPELYFTTALHELAHWTGHKTRLNRSFGPSGSQEYAFEELVAELSAAFSAARCGLPAMDRHHAAYLQTWIALLEDDPSAMVRASKLARQATEHLFTGVAYEQAA